MPARFVARSMRGMIATLAVTILGVVGLDATAIVANPAASSASTSTSTAGTTAADTGPALRLLVWSGQVWLIRPPSETGPDNDPMSDSNAAVSVDSSGRLHLSMTKVDGVWRSVQLESLTLLNFGTYRFVTQSSIATLAKPLDAAMFVIRANTPPLTNEIDLENSRALIGKKHGLDAQYVVQPYYRPHHILRYRVGPKATKLQQQFTWSQHSVSFVTRRGASPTGRVLSHFTYSGSSTPTTYNAHVIINLFIHGGVKAKLQGGARSVIVDSFNYTPLKS